MKRYHNPSWPDARPVLSVLIPFLGDDPSVLLRDLALDPESRSGRIEVIVLDDGTKHDELSARLKTLLSSSHLPASLFTSSNNLGRAKGRNMLASYARGDYLLFLDADMRPDTTAFLARWLQIVDREGPAVCFGGFTLDLASDAPEFAVHRAMAQKSDCLPVQVRQQQPEKHVFTSNLLVRKDLFDRHPFDDNFNGWGWEDVEWAMRVTAHHELTHIDNSASHLGLDTVERLMRKYEQSAPNFARIAERHPHFVSAYASYKVARLLKRLSVASLVLKVSSIAARSQLMPVTLRALALRFYRSALYAQAIRA